MRKDCKKYTNEELSRILGEHAIGKLKRFGDGTNQKGCINQAAYVRDHVGSMGINFLPAAWFDMAYIPTMRPETLLHKLEEVTNGKAK
jgi:hypothetical protein